MHIMELSSAELEPLKRPKNLTTAIGANGDVQTNEETTIHVHDLDLHVTVQILEDTPAVVCERVSTWSVYTDLEADFFLVCS